MNDFDWAIDVEPHRFFIIDNRSESVTLEDDEWVLIKILDESGDVEYEIEHYNLRPDTEWGGSRKSSVSKKHFNVLISKGTPHWYEVFERPKYTHLDR